MVVLVTSMSSNVLYIGELRTMEAKPAAAPRIIALNVLPVFPSPLLRPFQKAFCLCFGHNPPLPPGVEFVSDALEEVQAGTTESGDAWSDPIYFYPDGSTSDAKVTLNGQHQSAMQLSLRGVTGTVTMGDSKTQ